MAPGSLQQQPQPAVDHALGIANLDRLGIAPPPEPVAIGAVGLDP